jgi:heme-degrading monooxygenase HmoA
MFVRILYTTGDPARIDTALDRLADESPRVLGEQPGFRGVGIFADRELGKLIGISWWDSEKARDDSDSRIREWRAAVLEPFAASMSVERYEVAAFEARRPPGPGSCLRMTRLDMDPADCDLLADTFRTTTLHRLDGLPGVLGASLFLDRARGRGAVNTLFADPGALAASRGPQAAVRAETAAKAHTAVSGLEEFEVVLVENRFEE